MEWEVPETATDAEFVADLWTEAKPYVRFCIRRIQPFAPDWEDLEQEAALILLRCIEDYDEEKGVPFHLYFKTQLEYFLKDDLKKRLRQKAIPLEGEVADATPADDDVEEEAALNEACEEVRRAIGRLAPREETVIRLFYYEDLSLSEIAGFLGLQYATVANTKCRALKKLRRLLF